MSKIAVCIPSYNEANNIQNVTRLIDKGLRNYTKNNEVVIVNVDNNSQDNTSTLFLETNTLCKKNSIITNELGKGINLLTFFQYCKENEVDYALTIDADLQSLKSSWITSFLVPLINGNYDYITPIYKRSRFEGSTTNHFSYPLIHAISGIPVRQPIAGDFGFNKRFINKILTYPVNDSIKKYGIDIFMTLVSVSNKLKIKQIYLDQKLHNPSYNKMENMFEEVLNAFLFTWTAIKEKQVVKFDNSDYSKEYINCILSSRVFKHKKQAKEMNLAYRRKLPDNINIDEEWIECLKSIILRPESIDTGEKEYIKSIFVVRATNFWLDSARLSAEDCEKLIRLQSEKLRRKIEEFK